MHVLGASIEMSQLSTLLSRNRIPLDYRQPQKRLFRTRAYCEKSSVRSSLELRRHLSSFCILYPSDLCNASQFRRPRLWQGGGGGNNDTVTAGLAGQVKHNSPELLQGTAISVLIELLTKACLSTQQRVGGRHPLASSWQQNKHCSARPCR